MKNRQTLSAVLLTMIIVGLAYLSFRHGPEEASIESPAGPLGQGLPAAAATLARLAKLGQVNVVGDSRVVRHDEPKLPGLLQGADHLRPGTLQTFHHLAARSLGQALGSTAAARGRQGAVDQDQHAVVMHGCTCGVGRDVDRWLRGIAGQHPATSATIHQYAAGYVILVIRQREPLVRQLHHLPGKHKPPQLSPNLLCFCLPRRDSLRKFICRERDVIL